MTDKLAIYARFLSRWATFLFYCLILVFLLFYLQHLDLKKLLTVRIEWKYMLASFALSLGVRYWGALIWFVSLAGLGAKNLSQKSELVYVYAKSWLGRYIPGTAPWILGKIYFASQHGVSKEKLAVSALLESGLQILATLILGSAILFADGRSGVINAEYIEWVAVLLCVGLFFMLPTVFNHSISMVYRLFRKKPLAPEHHVNADLILKCALLFSLRALLNGLSLLFIVLSIAPDFDLGNTLFVIGANCFAIAISMLAVFAPGGIGVREGTLLILMNFVVAPEPALAVVILARLWNILIDIVFLGASYLLQKSPVKPG